MSTGQMLRLIRKQYSEMLTINRPNASQSCLLSSLTDTRAG